MADQIVAKNTVFIGEVVQFAGLIAIIVGVLIGARHYAYSLPTFFGLVAFVVGRKISSGAVAV